MKSNLENENKILKNKMISFETDFKKFKELKETNQELEEEIEDLKSIAEIDEQEFDEEFDLDKWEEM